MLQAVADALIPDAAPNATPGAASHTAPNVAPNVAPNTAPNVAPAVVPNAGALERAQAAEAPTARPTDATPEKADDFAFVSGKGSAARASATVPMAALFENATPEVHDFGPDQIVTKTLALAVQRISDTGEAIATFDPENPRKVLRAVSKTLDWLNIHLMDPELPDEEAFDAIRDMTQDATDLVQLLKAEANADGSREAVTALLQIKRGLQAELAA